MYRIAVTGHRPDKVGGYKKNHVAGYIYNWLTLQMAKALFQHQNVEFISGMALGTDTIFASIALKMKKMYPDNVRLVCAVPFETHSTNWPPSSREYYNHILDNADEVVMVSKGGFSPAKMQVRNVWMVDRCNTLFAVWNGTQGGTANCIRYAVDQNKDIIYIDQKRLKTYQQIQDKLTKERK